MTTIIRPQLLGRRIGVSGGRGSRRYWHSSRPRRFDASLNEQGRVQIAWAFSLCASIIADKRRGERLKPPNP